MLNTIGSTGRWRKLKSSLKLEEAISAARYCRSMVTPTVRFKAAIATLAFAPREAREVLQLIKDRKEFPIAMNASQMLSAIDEGRYIPS